METNLCTFSSTQINRFVVLVSLLYVFAVTKSKEGAGRTINKGCKLSDLTGDFKKVKKKKKEPEGSVGIVFQPLMD